MLKVFGQTDKNFASNGDAVLRPLRAKVRKEDNGDFYLDLQTGIEHAEYLNHGNIIVANTPQGDQAFRIRNPEKTRTKVTLRAYHVFYDSEDYLIADEKVEDGSCGSALVLLNGATDATSPFTVSSNIGTKGSCRITRASLYEAVQAVLDIWGGHLVRDNYSIRVQSQIGQDNGVVVRYKKNLREISTEENWDEVVTKLLPVGKDGILLNAVDDAADIYVSSEVQYGKPYTRTLSFDQDINEEDYSSEEAYKRALVADLAEKAQAYVAANCYPKITYSLKANLEKVTDIGDTIQVRDSRLGIDLTTHLIAYEYDCILKRYTALEFGNFQRSLSGLLTNITSSVENTVNERVQTVSLALERDIQSSAGELWNAMGEMMNTMTRALSSGLSGLAENAYTIVPLDRAESYGDRLTETGDGGIRIGPGISKVLVSGAIAYDQYKTPAARHARIIRNRKTAGNTLAWSWKVLEPGQASTVQITPTLAEVKEGDVIYLLYYTGDQDDKIGGSTCGCRTSLTVEVVA